MTFFNRKKNKKRDFYDLISDQSKKSFEGLQKLQEYMKAGDNSLGDEVVTCEKEGDEYRKILVDELNKTFITPFEREDINTLSLTIDDMLDYARSTYEEMQIFNIKPNEELIDMVNLLVLAVENINYSIGYLKNNPNISLDHAFKAKKVENKIELKYRESLARLFEKEDIKYILKLREIYRHISNSADKIGATADVICKIVVKTI